MTNRSPLNRLFFTFITTCILSFPMGAGAMPRAGQPAPGFKLTTTTGHQVSLNGYRGHVLVIDFFATWCKPCRESVPHLNEIHRKYSAQGLQVLGVSADDDGDRAVKAFVTEHKIGYPVAVAGETTMADFGVRSVPIMFVIDKNGKVAEVFRGFNNSMGKSAEQLIRKLITEK